MTEVTLSERCLVLAPPGCEAARLVGILAEAGLDVVPCGDLEALRGALEQGAGLAVLPEVHLSPRDLQALSSWIAGQEPWSDFPFILASRGEGRTGSAGELTELLGNVGVLPDPFDPATLVSMARVALRGRRRQYQSRERVAATRDGEETRQLMTAELQHRIKNILAVVQAIAAQTFRGAVDPALMDAFSGRIQTLTQAHDALTRNHWQPAPVARVVEQALAPHGVTTARFQVEGPAMMLAAKQALALSLALHELATNAAKYGALSVEGGLVTIGWSLEGGGAPRLVFTWREAGGPPVSQPTRKGFGTRLIQRSLAAEFSGTVDLDYRPEGLVCTIEAPLKPGA